MNYLIAQHNLQNIDWQKWSRLNCRQVAQRKKAVSENLPEMGAHVKFFMLPILE